MSGDKMKIDYRDDMPAIEVKDHSLYWGTHEFEPYLQHMSEEAFSELYGLAQERFWADAQDIADEFGYGQVYGAGRSGGWLAVEAAAAPDIEFERFAERIDALMDESRTYLLELVREHAQDDSNIDRGAN